MGIKDSDGVIRYTKAVLRKPGDIVRRSAGDYHRILVPSSEPVETLFITGKKVQDWGFMVDSKFVHNQEYLDKHENSCN